uniref:Uncharacterized protein n=1 Tax=Salmo trutta TaxID=8032 RepID=A0A673X3N8_SALTR
SRPSHRGCSNMVPHKHGSTADMVPQQTWFHSRHGSTANMVPQQTWFHSRHCSTADMVPQQTWFHSRHCSTADMVPQQTWFHSRHGSCCLHQTFNNHLCSVHIYTPTYTVPSGIPTTH